MDTSTGFRVWAGVLLAASAFSATFFSLVVMLKHRGWLALEMFFSGAGGPIVLCGISILCAYFLSRGSASTVAKWGIGLAAFLLTLLVQTIVVLATYCVLGECF